MTSYPADSQSVHITLQYFDAWDVAGQVWTETLQNFFCSTNNVQILYFILNPGLTKTTVLSVVALKQNFVFCTQIKIAKTQENKYATVTTWNHQSCSCLCFCIFIILHYLPSIIYYHYYIFPDSASSCTRVPQSCLCVLVRSEPGHVLSLRLHYSVISGTLVFP